MKAAGPLDHAQGALEDCMCIKGVSLLRWYHLDWVSLAISRRWGRKTMGYIRMAF